MGFIIGLLVIGAIALMIYAIRRPKETARSAPESFLYTKNPQLLSNAERSFFGVLSQSIGDNGVILAKVRVADLLSPKKGTDRSTWQKAFNRISAKHFDFVICDPSTIEPILVIELDDSSHQSKAAMARDAIKNSATTSANLPLIRIKAKSSYTISSLRESVAQYIPSIQIGPMVERAESVVTPAPLPAKDPNPTDNKQSKAPLCPKCQSAMRLRVSKKGKYAGTRFWGCSAFPSCRGAVLTSDLIDNTHQHTATHSTLNLTVAESQPAALTSPQADNS